MNINIDKVSLLVTCTAGLSWNQLEEKLNKSGFTLGYQNDSFAELTIEELLQKNPPNIFESLYGRATDNCISLIVRGKDGKRYRNKRVPRTAVGPDFRSLLLSMGKRFGQIEDVTMRIYPMPEMVHWHCTYWPVVADARDFIDELNALCVKFSFAAVYEPEQQPKVLLEEEQTLVCLRFAGLTAMVDCYMKKASEMAKGQGARVMRVLKRKTVPVLEEMMRSA
jgi:FAD/FMN-containing dehydrogenase